MREFKTLTVWKKAHQLALEVYRATQSFPREEVYGLTSQMRRAVASIPTNIAEGCGRQSDSELSRFLDIAMASASELEYQLLLAHDLGYLAEMQYQPLNGLLVEVRRMLNAFIHKLKIDIREPLANR